MNSLNWVQYQAIQGVGIISMHRDKANAYDLDFVEQFSIALQLAEADTNVNAVVLKSALPKFFCAGADIKAFHANSTSANQNMVEVARKNMAMIESSRKIFIAQIEGHALGGGLEIAMACDLRFAAEGHYCLGLPEIKLGLIPGNGGTQRLLRLVGVSRAIEILATGESFTPQQAFNWGAINRLYSPETLSEQTLAYATAISNGPALAIAATKKAIRLGSERSLKEGLDIEMTFADELYDTQDANEGFQAFTEKRVPIFIGQ